MRSVSCVVVLVACRFSIESRERVRSVFFLHLPKIRHGVQVAAAESGCASKVDRLVLVHVFDPLFSICVA